MASERDHAWRRRRLSETRLMVVLGVPREGRAPEALARAALAGGARLLELRMKGRPAEEVAATARRIRSLCEAAGALLIVNDDAETAAAADADGVHVGQDDLPPSEARRIVGEERLVGLSVHDAAEARVARAASSAGALDYVGVGTVYASGTRPDLPAQGPDGIAALLPYLPPVPAFAIGGITARNLAHVLATGIHGIAAGDAIEGAEDVEAATREMLRALAR